MLFTRKETEELRICIDLRAFDINTRLYVFPLHRIAGLYDKVGRARYFSSIDLESADH